ncbi:hypothetical protein GGR16_003388 [Chelatococcus caeni]|uniref:Phage tail tape measure protein n=1 Tax=Chelatococcus caeni TaxID=1348468 RepID=A0A840BXV5_9HYPH|nr:hypothetical protein [Chelatococcus caeni]MBB4018341.1 hypothetical protein [Chelatococcus caeni]
MALDIDVILKLVDKLSAPAKKAKASLAGVEQTTKEVRKATDAATKSTRGLTRQQFGLGRAVIQTRRRFLSSIPAYEAAGRRIGLGIRSMYDGVALAGRQATTAARLGVRVGTRLAAAGGLSFGGLVAMGRAYANVVDEQAKLARQTGFTIQRLRELNFVAGRQGVSGSELATSLDGLNKRMGELRTGRGSLVSYLKRANPKLLGQLRKSKGPEAAFDLMIDALSKIEDPARRAALAQAAFGRSGLVMTRIAELGKDGLADMTAEARRLMGVLGGEAGSEAEAFNDALGDVTTTIIGLRDAIASKALPVLTPMLVQLRDWIAANRELVSTGIVDFVRAFGEMLGRFDLNQVIADVRGIADAVRSVADAVGGWKTLGYAAIAVYFVRPLNKLRQSLFKLASGVAAIGANTVRAFAPLAGYFLRSSGAVEGLRNALRGLSLRGVLIAGGALAIGSMILDDLKRTREERLALINENWEAADTLNSWMENETAFGRWFRRTNDRVQEWKGEVARSIGEVIDDIKAMFAEIDLTEIGRSILMSLWEGMKSVARDIKAWIANLGSEIRSALTIDWSAMVPDWVRNTIGWQKPSASSNSPAGPVAQPTAPVPRMLSDVVNEIDQSQTLNQNMPVNVSNTVNIKTSSPSTAAEIGRAAAGAVERGTRRALGALHDGGMAGPAFLGSP